MQLENKTEGADMFNLNKEEPQVQSKEEPKEPAKEQSKEQAPIYLGGKKFNSVEELAEYTQQLEASKYSQPIQQYQPQPQQEKPLSELIFEDPEKALQIHEKRVIQKLKAEEEQKTKELHFWESFYRENKDLADHQDIVQFSMNKNWDELSRLHPDQAQKKIADYTRKTILKFRGSSETTRELPVGTAKAGPTNTQSAPRVEESRPAPVDFVAQLKKIQNGRKK